MHANCSAGGYSAPANAEPIRQAIAVSIEITKVSLTIGVLVLLLRVGYVRTIVEVPTHAVTVWVIWIVGVHAIRWVEIVGNGVLVSVRRTFGFILNTIPI